MAILYMHSFDYTTTTSELGCSVTGGTAIPTTAAARTGPQSLKIAAEGAFGIVGTVMFGIGSAPTSLWCQFAFRSPYAGMDAVNEGSGRFGIININEIRIGFVPTTFQIAATRAVSTILGYSSASNLKPLNSWIFIEASVTVHATAGSVLVKHNGVEVLNLTNIDTATGCAATISSLIITSGTGSSTDYAYYDDLIIGDTTGGISSPPGDARVEYIPPSAAGDRAQFTPSAGVNYSNVNETGTANDSNYNSSKVPGDMDLFAMTDLAGSGIVHAVQTVIRGRKDDAGTRTVAPVFRKSVNAADDTPRLYVGPDAPVTDTPSYVKSIFETSPDTGSAWGVDEINDIEYGYMIAGSQIFTVSAQIAGF